MDSYAVKLEFHKDIASPCLVAPEGINPPHMLDGQALTLSSPRNLSTRPYYNVTKLRLSFH